MKARNVWFQFRAFKQFSVNNNVNNKEKTFRLDEGVYNLYFMVIKVLILIFIWFSSHGEYFPL